jgi:hypothetical protein
MGVRVMRTRLRLGRDARVLREDPDEVEIESTERVAPGRPLVVLRTANDAGRVAVVSGWRLVRVGSHGPVYRGCCRWTS